MCWFNIFHARVWFFQLLPVPWGIYPRVLRLWSLSITLWRLQKWLLQCKNLARRWPRYSCHHSFTYKEAKPLVLHFGGFRDIIFIEYDFFSNIYLYQCVDKIALEETLFTQNSSSSLFSFQMKDFWKTGNYLSYIMAFLIY